LCEPPRCLQLASGGIEDQECQDDASAATLPDAAAAAATTEAYNAGAAVRQAALQKLAALQARLNEVRQTLEVSSAGGRCHVTGVITVPEYYWWLLPSPDCSKALVNFKYQAYIKQDANAAAAAAAGARGQRCRP
jgi:hypothetical protein